MKLAHSLALLVVTALTMHSALANFHILQKIDLYKDGSEPGAVACPSNYYNCKCFQGHDRAATIAVGGTPVHTLPTGFFSTQGKFCGEDQMNFYNRGNGLWEFYANNGNGIRLGYCNTPAKSQGTRCDGEWLFTDQLVCYSYICGQ
jgi:hypothetical protein